VLILTFHFVYVFVLVEFGEILMEQEQSSVEMFDKFTWKIENFSRLKTDMIYSEPFVIGGYPWYDDLISMNDEYPHFRIYWICLSYIFVFLSAFWFCFRKIRLYPRDEGDNDYLTIYLEAVNTANMSEGWCRYVKFNLFVFNQLDSNMTIKEGVFSSSLYDPLLN
jgi:ubiquitin carboxyl-terminal hydrolase 7